MCAGTQAGPTFSANARSARRPHRAQHADGHQHRDSGAGSLRADIAAAKANDTIVFAPSLNGQTITLTSGELDITKSLTIQGPGANQLAISGDNGYSIVHPRIFEVAANASFTLSGLTLENGGGTAYGYYENSSNDPSAWDQDGGAILNFGTLTVKACTLTGNSAGGGQGGTYAFATRFAFYGGAIYNSGTLTVTNSTLSDNSAGSFGISSFVGRGGAIYNVGTLTLSNTAVTGNTAGVNSEYGSTSGFGGGIFNAGTLTLKNGSTLSGDSAGVDGGGIYNGNGGTATVSDCTLSGDSAGVDGGGIYEFKFSKTKLTNCFFSNNSPEDVYRGK